MTTTGALLAGVRILLPRPAGGDSRIAGALASAGAQTVTVSLIEFAPAPDTQALDQALVALARGDFDWVAFTSPTTVRILTRRSAELGLHGVVAAATRIAAVGPGTRRALHRAGLATDLMPPHGGSASALAACWPDEPAGRSVLLPRSDLAAPTLPDALAASGHRVHAVIAYRTQTLPVPRDTARQLAAGDFHAVILTSSSSAAALGEYPIGKGTAVVAIGRPTADAARRHGLAIAATASDPTGESVAAAVALAIRGDAARTEGTEQGFDTRGHPATSRSDVHRKDPR